MFKIKNLSKDDDHSLIVDLDKWGGQQEARGNKAGKEWYIENLLEELDSDREFFFDTSISGIEVMPMANASLVTKYMMILWKKDKFENLRKYPA